MLLESCLAIAAVLSPSPNAPAALVERQGSRWVATLMLMKDMVEETHTELVIDAVAIDLEIPDDVFSEAGLTRAPEELR